MEEEYKNQLNRLISLNEEFESLSDAERAIVSILETLESEAETLNTAMRQMNSSRQDKRNKVLQRKNGLQEKDDNSVDMNSLMMVQDDDDHDDDSFDMWVQKEKLQEENDSDAVALKRLEDALFCEDLDMSSDESSTS